MAQLNVKLPDEFQKQLEKLANIDEVAPKMIDAAIPIYANAIRKRCPIGKTGKLKKSITENKAKKTKTGAYIGMVTFKGTRKVKLKNGDTVSTPNSLIAGALEYGRRFDGKHQFIAPAKKDSEEDVLNKMQEVFEEETK